ncbi:MAG TPA: hypothetical protein VFX54_08150, partial [Candidatus Binatia bacterium]|nr:hypothetical protein [Candidatus Binatia bacterium]
LLSARALKLARRWLYQGLVRIQAFTICADRCISPFAADLFIHCRGLFKDIFTEIVKNIPLVRSVWTFFWKTSRWPIYEYSVSKDSSLKSRRSDTI